jgi:hypothetical protein
LVEAQNIWGIAFPPDDWVAELGEDEPEEQLHRSTSAHARIANDGSAAIAGDEITIRVLHELQEAADAHAQDFHDRVKQLMNRLGAELEFDLRDRSTTVKNGEVVAMEEQIKVLRESLNSTREEIGKLEARLRELKSDVRTTTENIPPSPVKEAHRQLTVLSNSIVESMNRAAEEGLREYKHLLQKENQENAAKQHASAEKNPPSPPNPTTKH